MKHECDSTREGFPDLLFGEAEGGAASKKVALLEEVARCEACAREYRTMAETLQVFDLAAGAALPAEEFWPGYEERLRRRMAQEFQPNFWANRAGFAGEYRLTFVEDEGLVRRLARELKSVGREAELSWPAFRKDPLGSSARTAKAYGRAASRFFSQRDVALATLTSFVAVASIVGAVFALEHFRAARDLAGANPYENLQVIGYVEETEIPKEQPTPDKGNAGFNEGKGGGSKPKYEAAHGGGGGGRRDETPASNGKLPTAQLEVPPILTANPKPPAITQPHLPTPVTIQVDPALVKPDPRNIAYGDPRSTATIPSSGPGRGGGMGDSTGGGVGPGEGGGYGPGTGGNMGGGPRVDGGGGSGGPGGGGVSYNGTFKPSEVTVRAVITFKPEPGFTEEARQQNVVGTVRLRAVLSASGDVTNISVVKSLPSGLTEKAIAAARQIKFHPAQKDGRAVSQYVTLEYNFNIY